MKTDQKNRRAQSSNDPDQRAAQGRAAHAGCLPKSDQPLKSSPQERLESICQRTGEGHLWLYHESVPSNRPPVDPTMMVRRGRGIYPLSALCTRISRRKTLLIALAVERESEDNQLLAV
jgi:hypothetical protein